MALPCSYIIPNMRFVSKGPPPQSIISDPVTCPATSMLKMEQISNPILVFGQPFMGKTCLFKKLTAQAIGMYGKKHWIRMVDLRATALNCAATGKRPSDVMELLSSQLNIPVDDLRNRFKPLDNAKELVEKEEKLVRGELFLDGVDEIPRSEREYFLKLLPQLKNSRADCPIRIWINSRTFLKAKLLNTLEDWNAFDILNFEENSQRELLYHYWMRKNFPSQVGKRDSEILQQYTYAVHTLLCKEVRDFETTFATCPFFLEIIASILNKHARKFVKSYEETIWSPCCDEVKDSDAEGKGNEFAEPPPKKKGQKPKKSEKCTHAHTISNPTAKLLSQIIGMYNLEFYQSLVFTIIDMYCLKFFWKKGIAEREYAEIREMEYLKVSFMCTEFAIKTFPTYQYEIIIPSSDDPKKMVPNPTQLVLQDEDVLYDFGLMRITENDVVFQFSNKVLGDFFLGKHFASENFMNVRDITFDAFFLRVLLFDGEAKSARAFYDAFLCLAPGEYGPSVLRDFLIKQYKLRSRDEKEWEKIRNDGTVWHLAVMEGFHRMALSMIKCFHPFTDRELIKKFLKIKVPVEVYTGSGICIGITKVDGGAPNQRHLVSSLSILALFAYSVSMEDFLKVIVTFFSPEEIHAEFNTPNTWTPLHYAAMHSNLWFMMYLYNEDLLPLKIEPMPGIFNRSGQLPIHLAMSFSWFHVMILRDCYVPEYDKFVERAATSAKKVTSSGGGKTTETSCPSGIVVGGCVPCCCGDKSEEKGKHFRDIICYRDMVKDLRGEYNLLQLTHHECIRRMSEVIGEDINVGDLRTGNTMLHYAALEGNLDTMKYLLELGAFVEPINKTGKSPLHLAALYGHRKVFMCLVKNGAKVTTNDLDGISPAKLWVGCGMQLDNFRNGPMAKEDKHFFKACADIDRIMRTKVSTECIQEKLEKVVLSKLNEEAGVKAENEEPNGSEDKQEGNDQINPELEENCIDGDEKEEEDDVEQNVDDEDEDSQEEECEDDDEDEVDDDDVDEDDFGIDVQGEDFDCYIDKRDCKEFLKKV